jgi:hypothetical protein
MPDEISITLTDGKKVIVGEFLTNSSSTLSTYTKTYDFYEAVTTFPVTSYIKVATKSFTGVDPSIDANKELYSRYKTFSGAATSPSSPVFSWFTSLSTSTISAETDIKDTGANSKGYSNPSSTEILVKYVEVSSTVASSIDNPLFTAPPKTAFRIKSTTHQYYLKFGYLLQYVQENIIPIISSNNKSPLIKIQYSSGDMFCLPISISLDPKVCLVRTDKFTKVSGKDAKVLSELEPPWMDPANENKASIMDVYLNFDFITKCISQKDDKGNIDLFKFLSSICSGINRALGGVNNLEPIVNEEDNIIKIIDTTPIPGTIVGSNKGIIQLYGYYGGTESTFARKINLQTVISPEFATMITAGATKSGYVKGTEATAFSRWNNGLVDRFNEELIPPNLATTPANDPEVNYEEDFIGWITLCYGLNGALDEDKIGDFEDSIIKKNVSIVTEYYKYLLSKQSTSNPQSGTVGFIPIKLNFTLDGISGIKIYNKLTLDTNFLPKDYGSALDFIVTNVNHSLQGNTWLTDITSTAMPKTSASVIPTRNKTEVKNAPKVEPLAAPSAGGSAPVVGQNLDAVCGLASPNTVDTVYPRSKNWQSGPQPQIIIATKSPPVVINLSSQPIAPKKWITVTYQQYIQALDPLIDFMIPGESKIMKKRVAAASLATAISEQGSSPGKISANNYNFNGVEASGFKVFSTSDVNGKYNANEGETGIPKYYYSFTNIKAALSPLLNEILRRNMFAQTDNPNEWAWRYYRDWNGYGGRTLPDYKNGTLTDCQIISFRESMYNTALNAINQYSKFK